MVDKLRSKRWLRINKGMQLEDFFIRYRIVEQLRHPFCESSM
jgi:hypothetical protein